MSAPWIIEARYMAQMDAEEVACYAREQLSAFITADPHALAAALADREDNDKLLLMLARVLVSIHAGGEQATPLQTLELSIAIQSIADDAARYELS